MLTTSLSFFWTGIEAVRASTVPRGDYGLWIGASFVAHWILFFILPASPWLPKEGETPKGYSSKHPFSRRDESIRIRSGLVSTVHACVCIVAVLTWFATYDFHPLEWQRLMQGGFTTPGNSGGDAWWARGVCNTIGYFVYDILCMLYYRRELRSPLGSYIHHIVLTFAMVLGVLSGVANSYHFLYLLEELSTPALNMKSLYPKDSFGYNAWSAAFAVLFFLCRGVFGLVLGATTTYWCLWQYWTSHRDAHVAKGSVGWFDFLVWENALCFAISRLLNIYWMYLIASKVCAATKSTNGKKKVAKAE